MTSFHFKIESVSKAAKYGTAMTGKSTSVAQDPASLFERYVSHADKVENVHTELFQRYLGCFDPINGTALRNELCVSNISSDIVRREAFWKAVWDNERQAGTHRVLLRRAAGSADEWLQIAQRSDTPPAVAQYALAVLDERGLAGLISPHKPDCIPLAEAAEIAWAKRLHLGGLPACKRPIHYPEPRGGLVQQRLVGELPAGLSVEGRCRIAHDLATLLQSLNFCFTIAVHAPDYRNNRRNHHLHAIYYPRPAKWMPEGSFDVELSAAQRRTLGIKLAAKDRPDGTGAHAPRAGMEDRRPAHRQAAAQAMHELRSSYADFCNHALKQDGRSESYDPRSYEQMGIFKRPDEHLGRSTARQVEAGLFGARDSENALKFWNAEREEAQRKAGKLKAYRNAIFGQIDEASGNCSAFTALDSREINLAELRDRFRTLHQECEEGRTALDELNHLIRVAHSGATRLAKNCERYLLAIGQGTADQDTLRNAVWIQKRADLARAHQAEIQADLEPWAKEIRRYRLETRTKERALVRLEIEIEAAIKAAQTRSNVQADFEWSAKTVLDIKRYPERLSRDQHFAALQDHIRAVPLRVFRHEHWHGQASYFVPDLEPLDKAVFEHPSLVRRAQQFLEAAHLDQGKDIDRLITFYLERGFNSSNPRWRDLPLDAPEALKALHTCFQLDQRFLTGLADAFQRSASPPAVTATVQASVPPQGAEATKMKIEPTVVGAVPTSAVQREAAERSAIPGLAAKKTHSPESHFGSPQAASPKANKEATFVRQPASSEPSPNEELTPRQTQASLVPERLDPAQPRHVLPAVAASPSRIEGVIEPQKKPPAKSGISEQSQLVPSGSGKSVPSGGLREPTIESDQREKTGVSVENTSSPVAARPAVEELPPLVFPDPIMDRMHPPQLSKAERNDLLRKELAKRAVKSAADVPVVPPKAPASQAQAPSQEPREAEAKVDTRPAGSNGKPAQDTQHSQSRPPSTNSTLRDALDDLHASAEYLELGYVERPLFDDRIETLCNSLRNDEAKLVYNDGKLHLSTGEEQIVKTVRDIADSSLGWNFLCTIAAPSFSPSGSIPERLAWIVVASPDDGVPLWLQAAWSSSLGKVSGR
jgi:hypothetical protein